MTTEAIPPEYAVLNCHYFDDFRGPLCLELWPHGSDSNRFSRSPRKPFLIESSLAATAEKRSIFISRSEDSDLFDGHDEYNYFWVRTKMANKYLKNKPFSVQGYPSEFWNCESAVLSKPIYKLPRGAALVTIGEKLDQPLQFAVLFQSHSWHYKLSPMAVLLLRSEFDESRYSIDEYASHLTRKSGVMSSLQLSKDVRVVAIIKTEVAMGKEINVVELHFDYWDKSFADEITS